MKAQQGKPLGIRATRKQEAQVFGKFLLGMMSGGLLVAGGLVVGSVVAPLHRLTTPSAATDTPILTAEPATADAGAPSGPDTAETVPPEPVPAPETATPGGTGSGAVATGNTAEAANETLPAPPAPDLALAATGPTGPEAPDANLTGVAEPAVPAATEISAPQTAASPDRPAETLADAAATPDVAPPAPPAAAEAEATLLADAGTEAAEPGSAPRAETAPADGSVAEARPPEAASVTDPAPAPSADVQPEPEAPADASPEPAPAAGEPAEPQAAPVDESASEPSPEPALPPEAPDEAAPETDRPETGTGNAPAQDALPETRADIPAPERPGVQPDTMPGTPEAPDAADGKGNGSTFQPAPRLVRRGEGMIIGRGTAEATPDPASEPATDPAAALAAVPEDPRPIARFAATFENPDAKPPLAIVLVDDGAADLDRAGLAALPFPVSFALDPLDPATPERAAIYRAAGREVVMLITGIAKGAQASDVEVAFQSMEQGLPEAVAVMDLAEPTFQSNRGLAGAVVPILKAGGRGLLTRDVGLNAADQLARREDVEASVVFRDLDTAGGDRTALRRLMDRAVFKAGQDGRVTVVGTASRDLAAALLEWTVEGKAATVALAPVTAVLKVD
ncbi:MAG: divergent polysaccharide deacetylase family protein [Tabrizicola sp.]